MKAVSVAFELTAPAVPGPISRYHTIFGHEVRMCAGYPMWETDMTEEEFAAIQSDPEKIQHVRVAARFSSNKPAEFIVGKAWM